MTASNVVIALVLFAVLACQSTQTARDPIWGKQPCAHCHMLLSDPHSAAQVLAPDAEPLYFDDVGCLVEYLQHTPPASDHAWVRDANGNWLRAASAKYAAKQNTPMGYGYSVRATGELDFNAVRTLLAREVTKGRAP